MPGKKPKKQKKAPVPLMVTERPKRQIIPKKLDSEGISWREEKMLQRALYASLHPKAEQYTSVSHAADSCQSSTSHSTAVTHLSDESIGFNRPRLKMKHKKRGRKRVKMKSSIQRLKSELKLVMPVSKHKPVGGASTPVSSTSVSSSNSAKGSTYKAQRKFAQGSLASSPSVTPVKYHTRVPPSPARFMLKNPPKTEDFLTFLCLRGTNMLPKEMEFFNYCDPDLLRAMNTPAKSSHHGNGPGRPRKKSPAQSRAPSPCSSQNESIELGGQQLPFLTPTKSTAKKFVSKSPSPNKLYPHHYAYDCRKNEPSDDPSTSSQSLRHRYGTMVARKRAMSFSEDDSDDMPTKRRLGMDPLRPVVKSPKTVKKETGQKLVRKAKATMVARQIQMKLESSREKPTKRRGMLTRHRSEVIETEKFTEARLESLYSRRNPGSSRSTKGSAHPKTPVQLKSRGRSKSQTPSKKLLHSKKSTQYKTAAQSKESKHASQSGLVKKNTVEVKHNKSPVTDRQTRNTPSKMEAKLSAHKSANKRSSGSAVKAVHDVIIIEDDTPVKKPRRSLQLDPVTPSTSHTDVTSRTRHSASKSHARSQSLLDGLTLSAIPRDFDLDGARGVGKAHGPGRMCDDARSACKLSKHRRSSSVQSSHSDSSAASLKPRHGKASRRLSLPKLTLSETFPQPGERGTVVQAPTYHPSPEQFQDPMEYVQTIRQDAQVYGMCCIVPPEVWKPDCCVSDELRFITEIQHLHKMKDRWGGNVEQMECIRKHLTSQSIRFDQPVVGGIELDLPALSRAIRTCGGISTVADDKKKWQKVADILRIPTWAQDRSFKLYDVYCKYLLSYDTLTSEEKSKLEHQVNADRNRGRLNLDCVLKGKSRSLKEFFMLARSTFVRWFDDPPNAEQVEQEYWHLLEQRMEHVAVHSAHVDTKNCGGGFPTSKDSPYSKHGWNFNVLQHNSMSVLKHLGLVSGVTIPELHMGMLFSTNCWCSDPHGLPYISYLHTGADIIWYCIPKSEEAKFNEVLQRKCPDLIDADSPIWLPVDSIMMSPEELSADGVSVCRITQKQGEFMVIFPQSFTATICCGYNISESIRFASVDWVPTGYQMSQALHESCEPELFSMDRLLMRLVRSDKTSVDLLTAIVSTLEQVINSEISGRQKLFGAGLKNSDKLHKDKADIQGRKKRGVQGMDEEQRCEVSKKICYLSMVVNESEGTVYSLEHAYRHIHRKKNIKNYKLLYIYTEKELLLILSTAKDKVKSTHTPKAKVLRKQLV